MIPNPRLLVDSGATGHHCRWKALTKIRQQDLDLVLILSQTRSQEEVKGRDGPKTFLRFIIYFP